MAGIDAMQLATETGTSNLERHFMKHVDSLGPWSLFLSFAVITANASHPEFLDPLEAGWHGEPVCEKLHEDADHRILRCTFPPSMGHERHFHNPHFGYAIAGGRMRITDADGTREVDITTGSSFASDGVDWHEVLNVGDTTVIYLIIEPK